MKKCPECEVRVKGQWNRCPLCGHDLEMKEESSAPDPFPTIPLSFNRRKTFYLLSIYSFSFILLFFVLEILQPGQVQRVEYILLALMSLWLVVLILIRKRRNIAKGIVYLVLSFSLLALYFDYLSGWQGWSLTYVVPIVCSASLLAMSIAVRVVRLNVEDYVLYMQLAAIIGFIPVFFLFLGNVTTVWPSWISVCLSAVMLVSVFWSHHRAIFTELRKRMDV